MKRIQSQFKFRKEGKAALKKKAKEMKTTAADLIRRAVWTIYNIEL